MEICDVKVSPKTLIPQLSNIASVEGRAALELITVRVEMKVRTLEYFELCKLCGSQNVHLINSVVTTAESLDADLGKFMEEQHPALMGEAINKNVLGLYQYHCVAYLYGETLIYLTGGIPSMAHVFKDGEVDVDAAIFNGLLPSIYKELYREELLNDTNRMKAVEDIAAYACVLDGNSATTRYISNGICTLDCSTISAENTEEFRELEGDKLESITIVCRSSIKTFIEHYSNHPVGMKILAHDPICEVLEESIATSEVENIKHPEVVVYGANLIPMDTQLYYVVKLHLHDNAIYEALETCDWYKDGDCLHDEIERVMDVIRILSLF